MSADSLFLVANQVAMISWLLLMLVPRWKGTRLLITSGLVPLLLAVFYTLLVIMFFRASPAEFSSIQGVQGLFQQPYILLAGWVHYLAFDMLIGVWMVQDAEKRGFRHLMILPFLGLTFMFGPAGFLSYVLVFRLRRNCNR